MGKSKLIVRLVEIGIDELDLSTRSSGRAFGLDLFLVAVAVRRRRRSEFGPSVLAEFRLAGRGAGVSVLPVGLHVDGSGGAFVVRVASMVRGFGAPEGSGADGAQMVSDDDAVGRAESHNSGRVVVAGDSGGLQVSNFSVVEESDFSCGPGPRAR